MSNITNREELEKAALKNVCACYAYALLGEIDMWSDEDLQHLIDDSQYCHKMSHKYEPQYNTLEEELAECPNTEVAA